MAGDAGDKLIRVGVIGTRRGMTFAHGAPQAGMELVAVCGSSEGDVADAGKQLGVATYTDYQAFLEHDMDAVVLANSIHEHAPFAIQALRADKHVMSETIACWSLAQGVELIREVEKSGKTYVFAENYPFMLVEQEMKRLYDANEIGEFQYGEGEYIHPHSAKTYASLAPTQDHWRNWRPATYYPTHALAPLVYITGKLPVKVNALAIPYMSDETQVHQSMRGHDAASVILCRMDNGALVKLLQIYLRGHSTWTRVHGTRGSMEGTRAMSDKYLRVVKERFDKAEGEPVERIYKPDFPTHHDQAIKTGHGGSDFFTMHAFAKAIRTGEPAFFDVYRGVRMSIVATQAWRSALAQGAPVDVPDLSKADMQAQYANDTWAPHPSSQGPDVAPTALYR